MTRAQALPTRRIDRSSTRAEFVPEYGEFITWEHPAEHVFTTARIPALPGVRPAPSAAPPTPQSLPTGHGAWVVALALGLVLLALWPLQVAVGAVLIGSAWLIDSSLRDVVPGHARHLRRVLAPAPWIVAGLGVAATFVWPATTTSMAVVFLVGAAAVYVCCEAVALVRDSRTGVTRSRG